MSAVEKARAAWGGNLPDWVEALAVECGRLGQRATSRVVGYSAATVNMILQNKYGRESGGKRGSRAAVEMAVRGTIMKQNVACPVLGEIPADQCSENQKAKWSAHNPQRITLYHACRSGCVNSRKQPK